MKTKRIAFAIAGIVGSLCLCLSVSASTAESECQRAEGLFQEASIIAEPATAMALLERAVHLCPGHAKAWQNLGNFYEKKSQLDAALRAYARANRLDPQLGTPLAGLGDAALRLGRFGEAERWYKKFLAFLEAEERRGNPRGLSIHKAEYQERYERARSSREIHLTSIDKVVEKEVLLRKLKVIVPGGGHTEAIDMERLTLCIHFDFNSAALKNQGRKQLSELAEAMLDAKILNQSFLIEGHTDLFGEQDYNLNLSKQRAKTVQQFLSDRGVAPRRLRTKGLGETRPLVSEGGVKAQQINRRVEFVQMGVK